MRRWHRSTSRRTRSRRRARRWRGDGRDESWDPLVGFEAGGGEARGNGLARDRASSRRDRVTRSIAARDSQRTRDATHAPATDTLAAMQRRLAVLLALPLAACGGHGTPGNGPGDGGADASTDAPGGLDAATDG